MLCLRFEDFLRILGTSTVIEGEEAERGVNLILTRVKCGPKEVRMQNEVAAKD